MLARRTALPHVRVKFGAWESGIGLWVKAYCPSRRELAYVMRSGFLGGSLSGGDTDS